MSISTLIWRIRNNVQKLLLGFCDMEIMDLDHDIAKYSYPRVKSYRKLVEDSPAFPTEFKSCSEWLDVLDDIIYFLEQKVKNPTFEDTDMYRYEKGKDSFGAYFDNLWH